MQTSLPLLIVRPSILNPIINFSTHLWPVKWNTLGYTFALRIPFYLLQCWCNTCTNLDQQMIWSTSYHHVTLLVHRSLPHLLFTVAFVHRRQVLLKLHCHTVHRSKASNFPFTLATGPSSQVLSWSSPPELHDSMSYLICNELLHHMCEPCNKSKPSHLHGLGCSHIMYLWTNHLCISHLNTLVHTQLLKPNKDLSISPFW